MGTLTVLVIDDDPVIVKLLQVNFEIEGYDVISRRRRRAAWPGPTTTSPTWSSSTS